MSLFRALYTTSRSLIPRRHLVGIGLLGTLLFMVGPARGQTSPQLCSTELEAAEAAYVNQSFERAIAVARDCVQRSGVPRARAIQAYRLMTLSYLRQDKLDEAQTSLNTLLSMDPAYAPDPVNDPPSYVLFVSTVKQALTKEAEEKTKQAVSPPQPPVPDRPLSVTGIRVTGWDRGFERVNGLNVTVWRPPTSGPPRGGRIYGLALGLPVTGATRIRGMGIGGVVDGRAAFQGIGIGGAGLAAGRFVGLGVSGIGTVARDRFTGVAVNGLGLWSGGSVWGLSVGSVGTWAGGSVTGITVGGVGIRVRDRMRGLQVGGVAVGAGDDVWGLSVGGLGVLSWTGSVYGLQVGGLGVAAGHHLGGITLAPLGAYAGGTVTGLTLTGGILRASYRVRGIQAAGLGSVTRHAQGLTMSPVVIATSGTGLIVAPAYSHGGRTGHLIGASVSAFNHIRGDQRGLTVGVLNIARRLHGVQIGLVNYAGNNPRFLRLLPGINVHL